MKKEDVSVIIRTRNEERWIGHCIQSILDEIYKPEIIIIDNNSTDNTLININKFIGKKKMSIDLISSHFLKY